ncbi:NACHT domain-containing protein [Glycomyces salinus]|uniref:NACHT domain-containing protein n=1 Tax=Glycomyces salinus TaxID=980294 RepID=UPI0018EA5AF8|nr:hypothetical protein [Glycomyces salinus]
MASDFCLEELGPRAFEQLTMALAMAEFGPGVQVYGSGKDGGREGTFDGTINWARTSEGSQDSWNGYTVIQAKQCEHPSSPSSNLTWLAGQIRSEFAKWMVPDSKRARFPQYIVFVTNVRLSAADPGGGIDKIDHFISEQLDHNFGDPEKPDTLRRRGLRDAKVWHRDYLNSLISNQDAVRKAFPAILTVGDILERLESLDGSLDADRLAPILKAHAQSTLHHDRWVKFGEAGGSARQSLELAIIDVRALDHDRVRRPVLETCLSQGESAMRRSLWERGGPRHLVITGAPGNGKSTLTRYLTQVYRSHFAKAEQNTPTVSEVIEGTSKSLERLDLGSLKSPRWPLWVNLASMATALGPSGGPSLMKWLSSVVSERADIELAPADLKKWLKVWPSVIFFDGLDEVTSPELRNRVLDEITELVEQADELDADLLIVVTTRPTGYNERILPEHFAQYDLDYFTNEEALRYGRHITSQRLHDDEEQCKSLLGRFANAAADPRSDRLLKTPLQVLILTFILEEAGTLPVNRFHLFSEYYKTVFKREAAKETTLRDFFATHSDEITELHERVGLFLQVQCEASGEVRARLPRDKLKDLALERMIEIGYEAGGEAANVATRMLEVATKRLVLLTPDQGDTVSFEVRSLQELMADRELVKGNDDAIRRRLSLAARSPHWRNVWLFAAGSLFTNDDHRRKLVVELIEEYDNSADWPGWLYPVAPELASHLLDDGLASSKPIWQKRLVDCALRITAGPMPEEPRAVALGLSLAAAHQLHSRRIRNALKNAFAGTPEACAIASVICIEGDFGSRIPGQPSDMQRYLEMWVSPLGKGNSVSVGELLRPRVESFLEGDSGADAQLLSHALEECDELTLRVAPEEDLWPEQIPKDFDCGHVIRVLQNPDLAEILEVCLGDLAPKQWAARSLVARAVWSVLSRQPVGDQLKVRQ